MTPILATTSRQIVAALAVAVAAGAAGYGLAGLRHPTPTVAEAAKPAKAERKVLYWYDAMAPAQHFDKPGKSPFMDMPLTPRFADEAPGPAAAPPTGVAINPAAIQSLGVRLVSVQRADLGQTVDAAGVLEFNQRDVAVIQARTAGFVEHVYARAPGDVVRAGAPIVDLLVPSWAGAQAEYLAVRRAGDPAMEAAARQRLRLLGMADGQIAALARTGVARPHLIVTTPIGGAIQTVDARQGMTVAMGQTLAQVSGLSVVWLNAAVPEALAGQVHVGDTGRAQLTAFPGETFTGRVAAILPAAQAESRTLTVRIELANRDGRLRPGMFATVQFQGARHPALELPTEAVIRTGRRTLVMAAEPGGRFQPVDVQTGRESGDRIEIVAGLEEGRQVVASGQFLIDSEASLAGLQSRPLPASAPPVVRGPHIFETRGRIEVLDGDQITFSHDAVPGLGWPAMTMGFRLESPGLAAGFKVGDRVVFGFEPRADGPVVRRLARAAGQ